MSGYDDRPDDLFRHPSEGPKHHHAAILFDFIASLQLESDPLQKPLLDSKWNTNDPLVTMKN